MFKDGKLVLMLQGTDTDARKFSMFLLPVRKTSGGPQRSCTFLVLHAIECSGSFSAPINRTRTHCALPSRPPLDHTVHRTHVPRRSTNHSTTALHLQHGVASGVGLRT